MGLSPQRTPGVLSFLETAGLRCFQSSRGLRSVSRVTLLTLLCAVDEHQSGMALSSVPPLRAFCPRTEACPSLARSLGVL